MEDGLRRRIEARLGLDVTSVVRIEEGWDSSVLEVNGEWIVRVPRREEVCGWMRKEARLLPELAPALPVPVPRLEAVEDAGEVFFVAYRKLDGRPLDAATSRGSGGTSLAGELGRFLAALHAFPRASALGVGLADVDPAGWLAREREFVERCLLDVVPLLEEVERRRATEMFDGFFSGWDGSPATVLMHADLGPAHILHRGPTVTGVIDWSDACLGDPALDFAWLLHGTGDSFAAALLEAYAGGEERDAALEERALFYHRLGPWHEALFGIEHDRPELLASGLDGIRRRLPR